ncbi:MULTISPECIES: amidohydrolase [Auritidibacter]|uniref:Amidohydrolase n=1 Tax=Auritidibacter ignavus TaxID=678932 RepID=A0AAJ6DEK8_9MICC|nr:MULTISPECIES: amidohydrolase [Auritidibacter]PXA80565.1 hypothetical protein DCC25_04880 [Auritidibacter sp. NML120636]WGH92713.1 amidohydrolase [Auritidibacter ignavus]
MSQTLFIHHRIYTLAGVTPIDGAILAADGKIQFVGALDDARGLASESCVEVRLPGEAVLPGFHDAHIHTGDMARGLVAPQLGGATNYQDVLRRLSEFATFRSGETWVLGGRWDSHEWHCGSAPDKADLDAIFGATPVVLQSVDGHASWANSAALAQAGIHRESPEVEGGEIVRDDTGDPTGLLREAAQDIPRRMAESSLEPQLPDLISAIQGELIRLGITQITDFDGEEIRNVYQQLDDARKLRLRVNKAVQAADLELAIAQGRRTGAGSDYLRTGPVKFFSDGALGTHSALVSEPYADSTPEQPCNCGIAVTSVADLVTGVTRANAHGLSTAIHAIGDQANTNVLKIYAGVFLSTRANRLVNRIEHAQHLSHTDVARFASYGVVASQQPTHCTTDYPLNSKRLGDRPLASYAWKTLLDAGALVAFGSDAPVEPANPWFAIHAAVTRRTRELNALTDGKTSETLTVAQALQAHTQSPADALGLGELSGTLAPGKYADFIACDQDPFEVEPTDLWKTQVQATVIGGTVQYAAPDSADVG